MFIAVRRHLKRGVTQSNANYDEIRISGEILSTYIE
uniref:Uncharacterized protein n=1 Tax=Rhizophora mucronata TaxID=61149 RepID=A0A2P2PA43_RHIMU